MVADCLCCLVSPLRSSKEWRRIRSGTLPPTKETNGLRIPLACSVLDGLPPLLLLCCSRREDEARKGMSLLKGGCTKTLFAQILQGGAVNKLEGVAGESNSDEPVSSALPTGHGAHQARVPGPAGVTEERLGSHMP